MLLIRLVEADKNPGGGDGKQLHDYWTKGEGLARWANSPHPWTALHAHLIKHMKNPDMAARVTSAWYHDVFGVWPGTKQKKGKGKMTRPTPVSTKEAVLAVLTEAATHPGPYQWSHGWKPLTPRAKAIKKHKIEGSARGKKHPAGKTGGGLPKAGHTGKVGVKTGSGPDDKPAKVRAPAAPKKITSIAGKPVAKQPVKVAVPKAAAKTDVHPKYGKKVTVDGKHVGYIKQGEYSAHQKGSVGNVSVGTKTGKKFEMFDASGNKLGTAYNQADAKYEVEKAAKQPAPKMMVKLPVAKPVSSNKNKHGVDTSKIEAMDSVTDESGKKIKIISNYDGKIVGMTPNGNGANVIVDVDASSVMSHSPLGTKTTVSKPASVAPVAKPSGAATSASAPSASTKNQHGVDTSKVKVGDEVVMDWGEKVTVTSTDQDEYGNMTGQSYHGETTINPKFFKIHTPGEPGAAEKVAKPKPTKVAKYEKPNIPHSNSAYDDHNFKLPGGFQYGSEGFREVPPGSSLNLNYDERAAVMKYTGADYDGINSQLRFGGENFYGQTIKNLDSAFAKTPPLETGVRMRRLMGDTDKLFGPVGSKVGGTFSDKGYVSTTYYHNPEDAGSFSGSDISIDMPPGTIALAPDGAGEFGDSEGEVLLPRDTQFKVKGDFVDESGQRHIHLEVIVP